MAEKVRMRGIQERGLAKDQKKRKREGVIVVEWR